MLTKQLVPEHHYEPGRQEAADGIEKKDKAT